MSRISKTDEMAVARYIDGAMDIGAAAAFEQRLSSDSPLAAAVESARADSALFRSTRRLAEEAPAGFSRSVIDAVCRMPPREQLVREVADEASEQAVLTHFRLLLVAACLICGLALLFGFSLWGKAQSGPLRAGAVLDAEMQRLDEKVRRLEAEDLRRGVRRR